MLFFKTRRHDYQPIRGPTLESEEPLEPYAKTGSLWSNTCSVFRGRGKWRRLLLKGFYFILGFNLLLLVLTPIFNPSYSQRPAHFSGKNIHNEKIFIAANIIDEDLVRGAWGKAVRGLVDLIGPDNVFLSIYENDSGPRIAIALKELASKVKCRSAIISGHIDKTKLPTVQLLPDDIRVKRMTYLAEVRNHAIEPIANLTILNQSSTTASLPPLTQFDKLLFLNDVVFDPKDAADLLFSTNKGSDGRTRYHAACAMDYINPIKFYDRLALRDSQYRESGVPFYPWFMNSGSSSDSWHDVMAQRDAVRVKSCWGGMVAFEARWFTSSSLPRNVKPLRFRSEPDTFWDASECCLIHADLEHLVKRVESPTANIFVNPYVRVAYDESTFRWLEFTRRFERLGLLPHMLIGWLAGLPKSSARVDEVTGREISRAEWVYNDPLKESGQKHKDNYTLADMGQFGSWKTSKKVAGPGGFCGFPLLLALKNNYSGNGRRWEVIAPPNTNH
ncbi:hypothetical protein ABW20_dc0102259 [Dactylellina cionopaga]|nr:hypothetical protein ABW20_dc0102259 [Dactylellina cionopaga]